MHHIDEVSYKQSTVHSRSKVKPLLQHVCLNTFWVLVETWFVGWKLSQGLGVPIRLAADNSTFHVSRRLRGHLISLFFFHRISNFLADAEHLFCIVPHLRSKRIAFLSQFLSCLVTEVKVLHTSPLQIVRNIQSVCWPRIPISSLN